MAQQTSISTFSESERYMIFECVFEYISDIRTLRSLTLVSKETRTAVYRSNGLRVLSCCSSFSLQPLVVNGINIRGKNREGTLEDALRWIWTVGKRLQTVCLDSATSPMSDYDSVLSLLNRLAATEKRPIKSIEIHEKPCEMACDLVRENRDTLRRLCVNLDDPWPLVDLSSPLLTHCTLCERPESENLWSVVHQCERLQSLDLIVSDKKFPVFPLDFLYVLSHKPLKHLGLELNFYNYFEASKTEAIQEIVDVLSVQNLRENLNSLEFDSTISVWVLGPLVEELGGSHSPVGFVNVTKLTFDFLRLWCQSKPINWLAFWAVFPAVNKIENLCFYKVYVNPDLALSQNVSRFCKTYLEASASRSRDIQIELPPAHYDRIHAPKVIASVAKAVTLPDDQDWCVSHIVQIETETRDDKVERVTLRKDTTTLVFHFIV